MPVLSTSLLTHKLSKTYSARRSSLPVCQFVAMPLLHACVGYMISHTSSVPLSQGKRMAIKYGATDSTVSLGIAFFINAAILILAAAAFFYSKTAHGEVATLTDAYNLLAPAVGQKAAKILFAVALLAA